MTRLSLAVFGCLAVAGAAQAGSAVPTSYEAGHFFATPTLATGETLRLLVDTGGGGATWTLGQATIERLGLAPLDCATADHLSKTPAFAADKAIPIDQRACGGVQISDDKGLFDGMSGMLGGFYLSDSTWTFDYPARKLIREDDSWHADPNAHAIDAGIVRNDKGGYGSPFLRVSMRVDDEAIDMLFDTGATAHPTAAGLATMKTPVVNGFASGSYITTSVMDGWHRKHPEWPLVANADDLNPKGRRAIRVPAVVIADWRIGPVWFIERPDKNFEVMSSYMDDMVHGAIGGNVLAAFRVSVDYPHARILLDCVERCEAASKTTVKP